ncbi:MAG: GC-type dockerin domain-anchored protein [Planctomycetota bacterium]
MFKNNTVLTAVTAAVLAPAAVAQTVTVSVLGPQRAAPGETVRLTVAAKVTGLPAAGAIGGFGLDLNASGDVSAFSAASIDPVFELGQLTGTPSTDSLDRVVAGQLINVFELNAGVDQSTTLTLFSTDLTIATDAASGSQVTVDASTAVNGGIVLFEDAASGISLRLPDADGTTLQFIDLTINIVGCGPADTNNDGQVTPADFNAWVLAFNSQAPECDQNADGQCTPADFNAWVLNFNSGC